MNKFITKILITSCLLAIESVCAVDKTQLNRNMLHAVTSSNWNKLKYSIAQGADVNAQIESQGYCIDVGDTALILTTRKNDNALIEIIKYLIAQGADVNRANEKGHTALTYAIEYRMPKIVKYLIEHGANVNAQDKEDENTMLFRAVDKKNLQIIKDLIEHGANVNIQGGGCGWRPRRHGGGAGRKAERARGHSRRG